MALLQGAFFFCNRCDRVLLSREASTRLVPSPCSAPGCPVAGVDGGAASPAIVYDAIGKEVCMGDHKPVFLTCLLRTRSARSDPRRENDADLPQTRGRPTRETEV